VGARQVAGPRIDRENVMHTTRTASHRSLALVVAGGALASAALLASFMPAHADGPSDQQAAYLSSLVAHHDAGTAYTQMDDYVRTLIFWHQNPDWNPAN
jgi:hypothetical protein